MVLNILGMTVRVVEQDPDIFTNQGQAAFDKAEIWLANDLKGKRRLETLIHEMTHFALYRSGLREGMDPLIEEAICDVMGFVFSENKSVFDNVKPKIKSVK